MTHIISRSFRLTCQIAIATFALVFLSSNARAEGSDFVRDFEFKSYENRKPDKSDSDVVERAKATGQAYCRSIEKSLKQLNKVWVIQCRIEEEETLNGNTKYWLCYFQVAGDCNRK